MNTAKLVGIIDEDPYNAKTWSGSSLYFFNALKQRGTLHTAISAKPERRVQLFYQMLSVQGKMRQWKFKYHLNTDYYRQMTKAAKRELDKINSSEYQTIVQIGAWYDMTGYKDKHVVSYHDGNLATLLSSPYGYPRISKSYIDRTLSYERDLYKRIDLLFPMSQWLADSFVRDFGVPACKVFPIGAGINLPRVLGVADKRYDEPRMLFVGKDFQRKGGGDLLDAFKIIRKEFPCAELTIIGPELKSPPEGVRCLGFVSKANRGGLDQLLAEYERASVFVLPSLYEPFGIAFAEAMAHKLPCIGTNICAMPELIKHGKTGYVVPPSDPNNLARKVIELLREPSLCKELGDNAYEHYLKNYTWSSVAERMCNVMDDEL